MRKQKLIAFISLIFLLLPVSANPSQAFLASEKSQVVIENKPEIDSKQLDKRAQILREYFQKYNSPLEYHAQDFIDAADTYEMDWMLVPSIAGVESTFGKHIPGGYNAWGWGVYGDQALGFDSWRDGIFTVSKGLKENYINKGLTDPYSMNRVYAASPAWGEHVSYFMNDLESFSYQYENSNPEQAKGPLVKTAGVSAQLILEK